MKSAFILAGVSSNVGKTTVTATVLKALVDRGLYVQAMKCGPDYLDPTFHKFVTGRPSINIDLHLMGSQGLLDSFYAHSAKADVVVIEGVMGLYDGWDHSLDNGSAAHLSRLLGVPVVLVVDGSGISTSIAALVKGYQSLDERIPLAGVIINQVGSEAHASLLKDAIEAYCDVPVLGFLPRQSELKLESRHLGLKPAHEVNDLNRQLEALAAAASSTIDIDRLLDLEVDRPPFVDWLMLLDGKEEPSGDPLKASHSPTLERPYRVAYALDDAFYFYYEDNLKAMTRAGMALVPFSPLLDRSLPEDVEGLYLGGGYPELFARGLSENIEMRRAIKKLSEEGMPIYAECGGMMYLCDALEDMNGQSYPMVGALKGSSHMTNRLQRFGYVNISVTESGIFEAGTTLKGHEFHRSTTKWSPEQPLAYHVAKAFNFSGTGRSWQCGAQSLNTLGAYAHVHFASNPAAIDHWISVMAKRRG